MSTDIQQCPHCGRYCVKDDNCNYVVCGRAEANRFLPRHGCGRPFCFSCGKKLCGQMFDPETGALLDPNEDHNHPAGYEGCDGAEYCPGGHNSHKGQKH